MSKSKKLTRAALGAALLASGALISSAQAQSADALLDKLVEKGILTVKEANELRGQSDEGFLKAYQTKAGMPDWVNQLRLYGDVRGRFDKVYFENNSEDLAGGLNGNQDRNRFRYRIRTGVTATLKDDFEVGFRLTSGDPVGSFGGNALSGNSTAQDNGSKKNVYVDLAYGKWTPLHHGPWTGGLTIGKMENPFMNSDMVWDADYTPEGGALSLGYNLNNQHALKLVGAIFILDELNQGPLASHDPMLTGVQARWDAKWKPKLQSTLGMAFYGISDKRNLGNGAVENLNSGNARDVFGNLIQHYNPIVVDAALTYSLDTFPLYPGAFPVKLWGEYINNPGASRFEDGYTGGITFGKSGKKGTWEASWRYERLEGDAWYEEFVNDDFGAYAQLPPLNSGLGVGYRSGTNVRGHIVKASYSPSDAFTLSVTYYLTVLIHNIPPGSESGTGRLFVDAMWKF